jgi:hypothetical protein
MKNLYEEPERQQWQVEVQTSKDQEQPHVFYGATLVSLREQVRTWLHDNKPTYIRSLTTVEKSEHPRYGMRWPSGSSDSYVYDDFCRRNLDICEGPDHINYGLYDGKLCLEHVKKIAKYDFPEHVNSALRRGWHILELEKDRDTGRVYYILGHTEPDAF